MGPPVDSVQSPYLSGLTMAYGRYNKLVNGVWKPTNITGWHHPVLITELYNWGELTTNNSWACFDQQVLTSLTLPSKSNPQCCVRRHLGFLAWTTNWSVDKCSWSILPTCITWGVLFNIHIDGLSQSWINPAFVVYPYNVWYNHDYSILPYKLLQVLSTPILCKLYFNYLNTEKKKKHSPTLLAQANHWLAMRQLSSLRRGLDTLRCWPRRKRIWVKPCWGFHKWGYPKMDSL